jgi:putative chitinase
VTLTFPQLNSVMHRAGAARVLEFLEPLIPAMEEFSINTPKRVGHFLAQLALESGELRYLREIASGDAYEGRIDLGNAVPGDGPRFKGWGLLQITGRKNTRLASLYLYRDERLVNETSLIDPPSLELACRAAGWFWVLGAGQNLSHRAIREGVPVGCNLNELADSDNFNGITLAINGGLNGVDERRRYLDLAIAALPLEDGGLIA